jgi:hypothetical protein
MTYLYVLRDPRTDAIRYVGITNSPIARYLRHLGARDRTRKDRWIKRLKRAGLIPKMEIVDVVEDRGRAELIEAKLIVAMLGQGYRLTNVQCFDV